MTTRLKFGYAVSLLLSLISSAPALKHVVSVRHKPHKFSGFEERVFVPSHENLRNQNIMIDALGLERVKDKDALHSLEEGDAIVPITENRYVRVNPKLEKDRRFCRPWVNAFLQELGHDYFDQFEKPIQVNSAIRTIETQIWLLRWNRNAAPWHGETASAHLAGVAIDLQRRGLTQEQIHFLQQHLLRFARLHMVIVEEELKQPCFHVVVTGEYPYPPPNILIPVGQHAFDMIFLYPAKVPTNEYDTSSHNPTNPN